LTGLVKKIDMATSDNAEHRMGSFLVLLSDDDKQDGKLRELADTEKLKHVVLALDNPAGPEGYDLAKDAEVTVVLYVKKKVVRNFAFGTDKLDAVAADKIVAALKDILPREK
jgi:hypothetical protein